jgi:hypothetical protein
MARSCLDALRGCAMIVSVRRFIDNLSRGPQGRGKAKVPEISRSGIEDEERVTESASETAYSPNAGAMQTVLEHLQGATGDKRRGHTSGHLRGATAESRIAGELPDRQSTLPTRCGAQNDSRFKYVYSVQMEATTTQQRGA